MCGAKGSISWLRILTRTASCASGAKGEAHCAAAPIARLEVQGQAGPTILQWNQRANARGELQDSDRGAILDSFQASFARAEVAERRS